MKNAGRIYSNLAFARAVVVSVQESLTAYNQQGLVRQLQDALVYLDNAAAALDHATWRAERTETK